MKDITVSFNFWPTCIETYELKYLYVINLINYVEAIYAEYSMLMYNSILNPIYVNNYV